MPRISQDAKTTLQVIENTRMPSVEVIRRLRPPPDLTDEQREEFMRIVSEMPAEWFTSGNRALLTQYCRHVVTARRLAALIERLVSGGEDKVDAEALEKLIRAQAAESKIIKVLMTSLRMTPQAVAPPVISNKRLQQIESPWSGFGKKRT
jgi:hypothetical protein